MRIVIFAGGTGSAALQRGMYDSLENRLDGVETKVIVNAYDNGLSTGTVRSVMGGRVLGPSDVRKNHTTRLGLTDSVSPWLRFLGHRFSCPPTAALDTCLSQVEQLCSQLRRREVFELLSNAIEKFFSFPAAGSVTYDDFSLANIVYGGVAASHGFSLRAAASVMARAMDIPDHVLLNDDASLYLGAVTRNGHRVSDEAKIVTWDNAHDPFVDVFFTDSSGKQAKPTLCLEAWKAILESDLIILSSGTPWSSLIPTYASQGFKEAIEASAATVIMVMNRTPDRDSAGQSGSDLIDLLVPKYFTPGRLNVLTDKNSHPDLRTLNSGALEKVASFTAADLSSPDTPLNQHDPAKLAEAIAHVYFSNYMDSDIFVFDYDDTLCSREKNTLQAATRINVNGISQLNAVATVAICTGNAITAIDLRGDESGNSVRDSTGLRVFADGGVNEYLLRPRAVPALQSALPSPARCICPEVLLPQSGPYSAERIMDALATAGIPRSMISSRGNALIAIRPLDPGTRKAVLCLARSIVAGSDLEVREAGTSTVEIRRPALSKMLALKQFFAESNGAPRITYVGDELESGNDHDIKKLSEETPEIRCLQVHSPAKTAYFILTLTSHLQRHARH